MRIAIPSLTRRTVPPVLFAFALAFFAACGEAKKIDFAGLVPEGAPRIDQHGLAFSPNALTVTVGAKVYFTNSESAIHKVVIDGESITGDMGRGDVAVYTFARAGEFRLTCPYHPQMRATVTAQ